MKEIRGIRLVDSPVVYDAVSNTVKTAPADSVTHGTLAHSILASHNTSGDPGKLKIKFDAMASHDITYVGIIQTARASGLERFPMPYVLTNCHNSLCAVGGTINEDDHVFGLSAAKKYGGTFVPAHIAVIHQYMREMFAGCGKMILGSDSHTRYGAIGTMAIGEGGPELVKQLLGRTYDINSPDVVAVHLTGNPTLGVGPQDVALAIIGAVFANGFVKNAVLEFVGDGIANLSMDFRIGIDVMTTETTCLSSIWMTDEKTHEFLTLHGREGDYSRLVPSDGAVYSRCVEVDLGAVKPMIAMPFHPSNVYTIDEVVENAEDILAEVEKNAEKSLEGSGVKLTLRDKIRNGRLYVDQGVIAGCAGGGFENLCAAADILSGKSTGCGEFGLSVYPASQPVYMELVRNGAIEKLADAGAIIRTAFCGPCFGAGDVPCNNGFSIRHSTRNFPNREGSKPSGGQIASVALMDARSIAATAANGGVLTSAETLAGGKALTAVYPYHFDKSIYDKRVYSGGVEKGAELHFGPNITDWPKQIPLADNVLIKIASVITDDVTTTDELIPSGETSSYRSNPEKLSEFALSRKDPGYVGRAKEVRTEEAARRNNGKLSDEVKAVLSLLSDKYDGNDADIELGSAVCAVKPGDGSAREQAASCQRVLGGIANIACDYATKRYRSNVINWGMLPFMYGGVKELSVGAYVFVPNIREAVKSGEVKAAAYYVCGGKVHEITLSLPSELTSDERQIILDGCLINYYAK